MTEPRFRLTEQFLAQVYAAKKGVDRQKAEEATVTFVQIALSMGLIVRSKIEAMERDSKMLDLVGQGVPRVTVALRMGVSRKTLFLNLRQIIEARRAALRLIA